MAESKRFQDKLRKLIKDERYDKSQAYAIAKSMQKAGRIGPGGSYIPKKKKKES